MNYYERHLGDYAKDTAHLSMVEHGAYGLLLDRYYSTEQGIPSDQVYRIARARTREEKQAVDAVLIEYFRLVDGLWGNPRADEEIIKARKKINAAIANGKSGGRPKRNPSLTQEKPTGLLPGSENETQRKALQTPVYYSIKPPPVSNVDSSPPELSEEPPPNETRQGRLCKRLRVLGIDAAPHLAAWTELLPRYSDEEIIAAAEGARESKPGDRLHLNYLIPKLADLAKYKATGPPRNGGRPPTLTESRASTIAALTGRNRTNEHTAASETDVTADSQRLA